MLNKFFVFAILFATIQMFAACSDTATDPLSVNPVESSVIKKTQSMTTEGTKIISVVKISDDSNHWEVRVDMPGDGGIVKFEYLNSTNDLHQISGRSASFNYNIDPGLGLITYSAARQIALEAVSGNIIEWKLEKDLSDNMWQYRFEILSNNNDYEVRINAVTGSIVRVKD